jgi:hypothetical protein
MKSNSALPGGSLTSKPMWRTSLGDTATSAFFLDNGGPAEPADDRNCNGAGGSVMKAEVHHARPLKTEPGTDCGRRG